MNIRSFKTSSLYFSLQSNKDTTSMFGANLGTKGKFIIVLTLG